MQSLYVMRLFTVVPCEGSGGLQLGLLGQVQATVLVEADALHVSPGLPEQRSAVVSEAHCCAIEERVLGIVLHTVGDDQVEVGLELVQVAVSVGIDALPHGGKVHGVFNVIKVVRNLKKLEYIHLSRALFFKLQSTPSFHMSTQQANRFINHYQIFAWLKMLGASWQLLFISHLQSFMPTSVQTSVTVP